VLIHWVVMGALADPTISDRPLAETARVLVGGGGAAFIAFGAMLSTYGYLSGQMVSAPRLPYALAEQGDFPAAFARVHEKFRTPHVSILIYTLLVWGLAIYGSFLWNAVLSAVARLFTYAIVCAAVFQLRRTQPDAAEYRLPAAQVFATLGLAFCVVLVARMGVQELVVIGATMVLALVNWAWARQRRTV
jgi:amino acid transporter